MITPTGKWRSYGFLIITSIWVLLYLRIGWQNESDSVLTHATNSTITAQQELSTRLSPLNSTFGFQRIEAIVMPHRSDQLDILSLLQSTYNLDIGIFPGVYPEDVRALPRGVPEAENERDEREANRLPGAIACWRAHANLWRKMLREQWSSVLVVEGDVDWGLNIRQELQMLTQVIPELLSRLAGSSATVHTYDEHDPYHSESWDILQLGMCVENERILVNGSVKYPSPTNMTASEHHPYQPMFRNVGLDVIPLVHFNERLVKLSLGSSCTAAYAVSPRGAAKLLHKTTRQWHGPVDEAINGFSGDAEIIAISVSPSLFAQRKYQAGAGASSDMPQNKKRDGETGAMSFDSVAADSRGFDGEDEVWAASSYLADASATMAMSGLLWPERTDLGPEPSRSWILNAKDRINHRQYANTTALLLDEHAWSQS